MPYLFRLADARHGRIPPDVQFQVELDIVSGFQADPVGLLLQHRADLAIVSEAEKQSSISFHPLFAYEMVGICAPDHPLAAKNVWTAEDFIGETLITYPVPDEMLDLPKKILIPKNINPPRLRQRADHRHYPTGCQQTWHCRPSLLDSHALP